MDGERDVPIRDVEEMIQEFGKQGVSYQYYINKGIRRWYPEDIEAKLEKALKFIMEQ